MALAYCSAGFRGLLWGSLTEPLYLAWSTCRYSCKINIQGQNSLFCTWHLKLAGLPGLFIYFTLEAIKNNKNNVESKILKQRFPVLQQSYDSQASSNLQKGTEPGEQLCLYIVNQFQLLMKNQYADGSVICWDRGSGPLSLGTVCRTGLLLPLYGATVLKTKNAILSFPVSMEKVLP